MAELVVIGYSSEAEAEEVMGVLRGLERDLVIQTCGNAVVVRDGDGELRVATPNHSTTAGSTSGALWGIVVGMLFFMPVGGTVAGGAMGALLGRLTDLGLGDDFRQQVADLLQPGTAAVVILFQRAAPDRTVDALAPYGGTVLKTTLSTEAEQHLEESLDARRSAAAPA